MKASNIIWHIGDEGCDFNPNDYDIPTEVEIPAGIEEDEITDYLSDEFSFLVESYELIY